ncbi:MAG: sporulation transcriptional regulator SpoIIID [Clostridia bacterium]|nr:sporulation transcriptional regulator SpoIIID [Clostridia bacterium]
MKNISIEERAVNLAHYIIDSKDTVRGAAKKFGISKSTVHTERSALQKNKIHEYIELPQISKDSMPVRVSLAVRM